MDKKSDNPKGIVQKFDYRGIIAVTLGLYAGALISFVYLAEKFHLETPAFLSSLWLLSFPLSVLLTLVFAVFGLVATLGRGWASWIGLFLGGVNVVAVYLFVLNTVNQMP